MSGSASFSAASRPSPRTDAGIAHVLAERAGVGPRFLTVNAATEAGILLTLSVMFPFMVHLLPVPDDARLGARLLPMFYAPLLGALIGRKRSAVAVAIAAPWLNWLITSYPTPPAAVVLMVELLVFVGSLRWLLRRPMPRMLAAVPAYFAAVAAGAVLGAVMPVLVEGRPALAWAGATVGMALPGIAILVGINWLVVRNYPTDGQGPMAA